MRRMVTGLVLAGLGLCTPADGQERPDLSGSWVASTEGPAELPPAPTAVLGTRLWLQQAGDQLTVVRPIRDTFARTIFPIDGSEVRTRVPGGVCMGDAESIETVAWDGTALAFATVGSVPRGGGTPLKSSVKRLLRLQSPETLVVEATMRDGAGIAPRRVATVYRRSSDPFPPSDRAPTGQRAQAKLAQIAWLSGVWVGTTGDITVEERWTPATGGSMLATARTLRGTSITGFEFLCIAERDGGLVYTAMPNARTPATDFTLTGISAESVTFENPAHDFPKLIRYTRRPDGALETMVGGDPNRPAETVVLWRK